MSTQEQIEEILLAFDLQSPNSKGGITLKQATAKIRQTIKETLQEVLGENEPEEEFTKSGVNLAVVKGNTVRNQLRKEALNKLDSLLDPQED